MEQERTPIGTVKIDYLVATQMYHEGALDPEIATHLGVDTSAISRWRKRHGLPTKHTRAKITTDLLRQAKRMLRDRATKRTVAEAIGVTPRTVQQIRSRMKQAELRKGGCSSAALRKRALGTPRLHDRIIRAIGRGLPREVRDDAISDLYVAVLEGRCLIDEIETRAPTYRNRAYSLCGSQFGPRSLDYETEEGLNLSEMIADEAASDEMERALERAWEAKSHN